jgi:CO/xanthine dehydrogenase FAD-binding subunit
VVIVEYTRPKTLEEALSLLNRPSLRSLPLAGGSQLNGPSARNSCSAEPVAAVDLQALGLDGLNRRGNYLELGAMARLQALLDFDGLQAGLKKAIRHEAAHNLRQVATVAGTLVAASGRSPFTTAMLALEAGLLILPEGEQAGLGELLPFRQERLHGRLITQATIPLNARLAYQYVARTPADQPIVCAALAAWPSGRARLALGGFGPAPLMAFDGTESAGVEAAARSAYSQAEDQWASAAYRQEVAGVLARRCWQEIAETSSVQEDARE